MASWLSGTLKDGWISAVLLCLQYFTASCPEKSLCVNDNL